MDRWWCGVSKRNIGTGSHVPTAARPLGLPQNNRAGLVESQDALCQPPAQWPSVYHAGAAIIASLEVLHVFDQRPLIVVAKVIARAIASVTTVSERPSQRF